MRIVLPVVVALEACRSVSAAPVSGDVAVTANENGFSPSKLELVKGARATLVFTRTTEATCAQDVVFPDLKIKKPLPLNTPVRVEIPTDSARTLRFTCGMGMFESSLVVR